MYRPIKVIICSTCNGVTEENLRKFADSKLETRFKKEKQESQVKRILWESNPITGLDRPRGFQEVKVPRFLDNGAGCW